jgi:hypothetical protein
MTAQADDWIIRGIKGELYPCKPDIFAATYEPEAASGPSLRGKEPEWISVEEKLPDLNGPCVLIAIDYERFKEWAESDPDNQEFFDNNWTDTVDIWNPLAVEFHAPHKWLTHWQPKPAPPKTEASK